EALIIDPTVKLDVMIVKRIEAYLQGLSPAFCQRLQRLLVSAEGRLSLQRMLGSRVMEGLSPIQAVDGVLRELTAEDDAKWAITKSHGSSLAPRFGRPNRIPLPLQPRIKEVCGARTRQGRACERPALKNGRCRNHGGLSTGPTTPEGKARIAEAQRK